MSWIPSSRLMALLLVSGAMVVTAGAEAGTGSIETRQRADRPEGSVRQLRLVGTITCEACREPFAPVVVLRDEDQGKLLHLRLGDELRRGVGLAVVHEIGVGYVVLRLANQRLVRLDTHDVPEDDGGGRRSGDGWDEQLLAAPESREEPPVMGPAVDGGVIVLP